MPKLTVPIYADGDRERLRELEAAVEVAKRNAKAEAGLSPRGGDALPEEEVKAAEEAYDAFLDEAAERAEAWVLESIGFREFRQLLKDNPPRTTTETAEDGSTKDVADPLDAAWGVNVETLPEKLLLFVDPEDDEIRTVVELRQDGVNIADYPSSLRKRIKRLSEGQFDALWVKAFLLNKAGVSDPKLERFSPATLRSNET